MQAVHPGFISQTGGVSEQLMRRKTREFGVEPFDVFADGLLEIYFALFSKRYKRRSGKHFGRGPEAKQCIGIDVPTRLHAGHTESFRENSFVAENNGHCAA